MSMTRILPSAAYMISLAETHCGLLKRNTSCPVVIWRVPIQRLASSPLLPI
jgi:hypothetical protein